MKHLLVICLFFTSVYSDGKRDRDSISKNETYSFMVAMVKYKEDGQKKLCTSTKPVKGYNYFVTNETGYIIGDVESFEKDSTETCEGWMTIWNLNILNLRSSDIINSYQYLIIKTKTDFSIKFREDFTKLCQIPVDILLKLTGIPEIKSSSSSMTTYYLGSKNDNTRYGVTLLRMNGDCKLLIIEVGSDGLRIVFEEIFESGKGIERVEIANMTDINDDGFADTLIIDLGDYGGIYLIESHNGQWKATEATPYDPC